MPTVFRIYTENVNRKEVLQVVAKKFENFAFQPTTGYFRGQPEKSVVIEIVNARKKDVAEVARSIRRINGQKSVLVLGLQASVERTGV